jgi:hypothetical protein
MNTLTQQQINQYQWHVAPPFPPPQTLTPASRINYAAGGGMEG